MRIPTRDNARKSLVSSPQGGHLWDLCVDRRIRLKWILDRDYAAVDWSQLAHGGA
jgi:hypothetical protein